jgi:ribosomal protein S18 acetylase RimI-like enzyme
LPDSVLDNPAWSALAGPQRALASATALAGRFDPEISPFGGFSEAPSPDHWRDLAELIGPSGSVALVGVNGVPLSDWTLLRAIPGVQMVFNPSGAATGTQPGTSHLPKEPEEDPLLPLGDKDVGDMLALVALAQPGPFLSRTVEFGGYLGIRRGGQLIAMAGQRLRPPGYTEISAVATDPDHRRKGLAERLVLALVEAVLERGETPFLHASADNLNAIRLYERLGFTLRREVTFSVVQAPS